MNGKKNASDPRLIIAVLLTLLLLTAAALAARLIYLRAQSGKGTTAVVPDNLISESQNNSLVPTSGESVPNSTADPEPATSDPALETEPALPTSADTADGEKAEAVTIALYKGHPEDNERFRCMNMLPGDRITKRFSISVSHHSNVTVSFTAVVTRQSKNLADMLRIRVIHEESQKTVYDGTFADISPDGCGELFPAAEKTETIAHYTIEVLMPASAGNEYQGAELMADFAWYVKETETLDPPKTGDSRELALWMCLLTVSFAMILVLLFRRRRKEREYADGNPG